MNVPTRAVLALAAVAAVAAAGAAYSRKLGTSGDSAPEPSAGMSHAVHIADERGFIEHMVPHHREAADVSRIVAGRTGNAEIKALAERIVAAQTPEIARMEGWYRQWYAAGLPADTGYVAMMDGAEAVPAEDLDAWYLSGMIAHHEGAISAAEQVRDKAGHQEIREMAASIIADQTKEIGVMRAMLQTSAGTPSHGGH